MIDQARAFHEGLRLFNEGEWFDAHEAWEDIWHQTSGQAKRFCQGLIQCAVTIEHIRRGNPRGVRSVWKSAQNKFENLPEVYMGINVSRLLADMKHTVDPVLAMPPSAFEPGRGRGQKMPFDPAKAPRIELEYDPFADARKT